MKDFIEKDFIEFEQDVLQVKQLGDRIGYGHMMLIAHELWAHNLEKLGVSRSGAFVPVVDVMVKDEYKNIVSEHDLIYKDLVESTLSNMEEVLHE